MNLKNIAVLIFVLSAISFSGLNRANAQSQEDNRKWREIESQNRSNDRQTSERLLRIRWQQERSEEAAAEMDRYLNGSPEERSLQQQKIYSRRAVRCNHVLSGPWWHDYYRVD